MQHALPLFRTKTSLLNGLYLFRVDGDHEMLQERTLQLEQPFAHDILEFLAAYLQLMHARNEERINTSPLHGPLSTQLLNLA